MRESIWSDALSVARQDYIVHILRQSDTPIHMNILASVLGSITGEPVPEKLLRDPAKFDNSRFRRIITDDLKEISMGDTYCRTYIISGNRGVKIASHEELVNAVEAKRKAARKLLWEAKVLLKKAGLEDNIRLEEREEELNA